MLVRLQPGDTVDVSYNGTTWWSGIYKSINPNGTYRVEVTSKHREDDFSYDMVEPTPETISKYKVIDEPIIEESEDQDTTVGSQEGDPADTGLEAD